MQDSHSQAQEAALQRTIIQLSLASFASMTIQRLCDPMLPELARDFSVDLGQAAAVIGHRAQTGARMVYDFISEKVVHDKGDRIETGSITASLLTHADGQNTLTASDLEAPWRGPEPRKQGHKQADKPAKPHKQAQPVKAVKESAKEAAKTTEKKPG